MSVVMFAFGQRTEVSGPINLDGVLKVDFDTLKAGTPVTILNVVMINNRRGMNDLYLAAMVNYEQIPIPASDAGKLIEFHPRTMEDFWKSQCITQGVYRHYSKKGYQIDLRNRLIADADDYLNSLSSVVYNNDSYIEDYIRTIFTGLSPQQLNDNRPERAAIEIINSTNPDAYMMPNGVLIISTGLLSVLDSVEELTAILTSEIVHYVLDDQLRNASAEEARLRNARTWDIVLGAFATGAEIITTANDDDYEPGLFFAGADFVSSMITVSAASKLGLGYSKKQVEIADNITLDFLTFAGMDPGALKSALKKIKQYYIVEKDTYALTSDGSYGNIDKRMEKLVDTPTVHENRAFQKTMSSVNTMNASIHERAKKFDSAMRMAKKNMDNNLASADDYVIYIRSKLNLTNSPESNRENLEMLQAVKDKLPVPDLGLSKLEILLLMRMDDHKEVMAAINEYVELLNEYKSAADTDSERSWVKEELNWANKMYEHVYIN